MFLSAYIEANLILFYPCVGVSKIVEILFPIGFASLRLNVA